MIRTNTHEGLCPLSHLYYNTSSIKNNMKRIQLTDMLVFILMATLLLDIDFNETKPLEWIALIVSSVWLVIFIIKILLPTNKKGS
ncbi:hypothetical protein Pryu01_01212 [Paraliobacillus ryukyuensis]|uniref:Uncharacterized protein n=1 Tax=Paraliobacillus ryukyuensis TaxID=200904 RepID=A0A366DPS9_9BACI|nr:hypothetical protein DES48_11626 [Paraliobacillus ryukyuensis]